MKLFKKFMCPKKLIRLKELVKQKNGIEFEISMISISVNHSVLGESLREFVFGHKIPHIENNYADNFYNKMTNYLLMGNFDPIIKLRDDLNIIINSNKNLIKLKEKLFEIESEIEELKNHLEIE